MLYKYMNLLEIDLEILHHAEPNGFGPPVDVVSKKGV
jgi:hypothetical protein